MERINNNFLERIRSLNISKLTPIQQIAIPAILDGESVVIRSQTGSGKTLAYLIPTLQMLSERGGDGQMLILLPTRELAQQVGRVVEALGERATVICGGVEYDIQREAIARSSRVVVATVGRLVDLMQRGEISFVNLSIFVLDEADQMVEMGFRESVERLAQMRSETTQTVCVSATLAGELHSVVGDMRVVESEGEPLAAQRVVQRGYFVENSLMDQLLLYLVRVKQPSRAIIFCRSRGMANRLNEMLRGVGYGSEAIHSDRSQVARDHILKRFAEGETTLLVASDLVARGIDVDGVSHIFNYGLPQSAEQYIHRIGRTGRGGAEGEALTLMCPDEKGLLDGVCRVMRQAIAIESTHPYITPNVTRVVGNIASKRGRKSTRCRANARK